MRFEGTLKRWDDGKGAGFIASAQGVDGLFVHVSDIAHGGQRPMAGERLTFEVETGNDGRKKAVRVQRAGDASHPHAGGGVSGRRYERHAHPRSTSATLWWILGATTLALGGWAYTRWGSGHPVAASPAPPLPLAELRGAEKAPSPSFRCDGRTHCSQMTSCAEATHFLRSCPGVKMDGNNDGVPCEQQWCTGG